MARVIFYAAVLSAAMLCNACGNKGPLYVPYRSAVQVTMHNDVMQTDVIDAGLNNLSATNVHVNFPQRANEITRGF